MILFFTAQKRESSDRFTGNEAYEHVGYSPMSKKRSADDDTSAISFAERADLGDGRRQVTLSARGAGSGLESADMLVAGLE